MRRKIVIWSILFVSISGCYMIVSNFPRSTDVIELENGVKITIEVNENIMAMRDPIVSKTITIDYGNRQLTHRSNYDAYSYRILLVKQKEDTIWILEEEEGNQPAECWYSKEKAKFQFRIVKLKEDIERDTLLDIRYEDFAFSVH